MKRYSLAHTYDARNRLASTTGDQGYKAREYSYDSLGNLTYEKTHNKVTDCKYNNLNQLTRRIEDGKDNYTYEYDRRGNQVKEVYNKNLNNPKHDEIVATYIYDSTNRMAKGTNTSGEQSFYIYNGLGHLVGNEWIVHKNAYGYTGAEAVPSALSDPANPSATTVEVGVAAGGKMWRKPLAISGGDGSSGLAGIQAYRVYQDGAGEAQRELIAELALVKHRVSPGETLQAIAAKYYDGDAVDGTRLEIRI